MSIELINRRRPMKGIGFRILIVVIGVLLGGLLVVSIGRLAWAAVAKYGLGLPGFYVDRVFNSPQVLTALGNTIVIAVVASALATAIAVTFAWLNERTNASLKSFGRIIPLVPFLMPGLASAIGWLILASPNAGLLNVVIRQGLLGPLGIELESGPFNLYSLPGLMFLYTVELVAYAYLIVAAAIRNLDPGIEEAGKMAGANPIAILFRLVVPAIRPALISSFLLCMLPAMTMLTIPLVIGKAADIPVLSVHILELVKGRFPAEHAEAFLIGVLLFLPLVLIWVLQRRYAASGTSAVIGGRFSGSSRIRLSRGWRVSSRALFVAYLVIAVGLPVLGLIYLSGVGFWQPALPTSWNPIPNIVEALGNSQVRTAIFNSVLLGLIAGLILVMATFTLSYGQRMFPRFAPLIDIATKGPAPIANVLLAIAVLLTFAGPPFWLGGTPLLLLIGYFLCYVPYASVSSASAQQQVGQNLLEAAQMSGASPFRTFRAIAMPLSLQGLIAGFILTFVFVIGDVNVSLLLGSAQWPVIGFFMYDYYEFGSLPLVAAFCLIVTAVSLTAVSVLGVLSNRGAR